MRNEVILQAWLKKHEKMSDQDATQIVLKDMGNKIIGDKENPFVLQITGMKIILDDGNPISDKNQEANPSNPILD